MQKSRDSTRKSDFKQIQTGLELYMSDCGSYPTAQANRLPDPLTSSCTGSPVTYIQTVPKDPKTNRSYVYINTSQGGYILAGCLENDNDPDGVDNGTCPSGKSYGVRNP